MYWRNEKEWALWDDRNIDGVTYSFTHLRSFDMEVVKEARGDWAEFRAIVRVVFDCPDGAIRYLVVTGVPVTDEAADRCTTRQPNDGLPVYLPSAVSLGDEPPSALEINGRGQISAVDGGPMPQSLSVTYGSFTRTLVVTATGRVASPAS